MTYLEFEEELKKLSKKQLLKFIDYYDNYVIICNFNNEKPYNIVCFYENMFIKEVESEKSYKG